MIYESSNHQPAVNVYPNGGGFGGGGESFGGNGAWWIIILFLFAMMNGWGNNNGGNNGGGGSTNYVPYMPFMVNGYGGNTVQQGFDQAAVMSGINSVNTGLYRTEANLLANMNNNQNASTAAMNGIAMSLQNCCCENRAATADLKYTVATEACADRAAVTNALQEVTMQNNANTQRILDMMCQDKIDAKNERIADLQNQLTMAQLAASQTAQTAQILANNEAQTAALEQYLAPNPRPAYIVQNPNCCANNFNTCGCGR